MLTSVVADLLDVHPIIFSLDVFAHVLGLGGKAVDFLGRPRQNKQLRIQDR